MAKWFKKLIKLFVDRKTWVRQIFVAALASGIAWQVGDLLIKDGGLVAAIICALSIRISLYRSVREGFGQIVGTAIGAAVALACVTIFSFGIISVAMTVLLCSVVARALHLGEVASVNVPVTALIVIHPGLNENTAFSRLSSTLVGAGIAIVFSYFSHSKTPTARTVDQVTVLANKCAKLLGDMSEGVAGGLTQALAGKWLARARLLVEDIPGLRAQAIEARGHAKWFQTSDKAKAQAQGLYIRGIAIEHTAVQVRTMARTLFDYSISGGIEGRITRAVAQALSDLSYAVSSKAEQIRNDNGDNQSQSAILDARLSGVALADSIMEISGKVDQIQIIRGISLVSNITIITDSLDESSPALHNVLTPGEPATHRVLKVSPIEQGARIGAQISKSAKPLLSIRERVFNYLLRKK